jgi:hypothetical protein
MLYPLSYEGAIAQCTDLGVDLRRHIPAGSGAGWHRCRLGWSEQPPIT